MKFKYEMKQFCQIRPQKVWTNISSLIKKCILNTMATLHVFRQHIANLQKSSAISNLLILFDMKVIEIFAIVLTVQKLNIF